MSIQIHKTDWGNCYEAILHALPDAALNVYGERLVSLVLFGSVARGTHRPDSDLDLLLIAEPLSESRWERTIEFEAVEDVLQPLVKEAAQAGAFPCFSPLIRTSAELELGSFAFLDIPTDARYLYDPKEIAKDYFARLADRLRAQGAEKRYLNGSAYWLLKPSAKPGEPIPI
jgi:uncharacterized protein